MEHTDTKIDFLAIGDVVTDAFIRIKDASVHCDINNVNCTLSMRFGDKIPFESATVVKGVGNSANAAVSAARLGLNASLVATIGNDQNGRECVEALQSQRVDTTYITTDTVSPTNYHYVLWYESERTILVQHAPFTYKLPLDLPVPQYIYLSSLAETSKEFHHDIARYITAHPEAKLAFQPGTFQMKLGTKELEDIYAHTYIFFCNVEEAQRILSTTESEIKSLLNGIAQLGPKIVVITDGPKGLYASDGAQTMFLPMYPDIAPPVERTGAGDACASSITVALAKGLPLEEALLWGPINSMSVVQHVGAQEGLLSEEEIKEYLVKAPENYKITIL